METTDAIITRNILKAVRSSNELHTCQRQVDDIASLMLRLSRVTGIPVPPTWRSSAGATSPQYSPASPGDRRGQGYGVMDVRGGERSAEGAQSGACKRPPRRKAAIGVSIRNTVGQHYGQQ